jgi:hypothetical protein
MFSTIRSKALLRSGSDVPRRSGSDGPWAFLTVQRYNRSSFLDACMNDFMNVFDLLMRVFVFYDQKSSEMVMKR